MLDNVDRAFMDMNKERKRREGVTLKVEKQLEEIMEKVYDSGDYCPIDDLQESIDLLVTIGGK